MTAVDDLDAEGLHVSVITHTASSGDAAFNAAVIEDVTATIADNDHTSEVAFVAVSSMAAEAAGTHNVGVVLTVLGGGPLAQDVTADVVDASGGSASTPGDYSFATQTVTFPAGSMTGATQTVAVTFIDNNTVELDETIQLALTNVTGQGGSAAPATHTATIVNDDDATVPISDAQIDEGDSGTTTLNFTVTLSNDVDTSAPSGLDFGVAELARVPRCTSDFGSVATSATHILSLDDALAAFDGVFLGGNSFDFDPNILADYFNGGGNVYICGGIGGSPVNEAATWDPFLNQFGLDMLPQYVITANIPIASPHPLFAGVTALYQAGGNPIVDLDPLNPANEVLVTFSGFGIYGVSRGAGGEMIPVNNLTKTISVTVNGDIDIEPDESLLVNLLGLESYGRAVTLDDNSGIGTILNDDNV